MEGALSPEVEVVGVDGWADAVLAGDAEGGVKNMVSEAGSSCSVVWVTVMGIAGLWYFNRGR